MVVDVMCRIGDEPFRPAQLVIGQKEIGLVSWSVIVRELPPDWQPPVEDLPLERHLPDGTVWIGEAYPMGAAELEPPAAETEQPKPRAIKLHGTGPFRENFIPVHADVVLQRVRALVPEDQDEHPVAPRAE